MKTRKLLLKFLNYFQWREYQTFLDHLKNPQKVQCAILLRILKENSSTQFGQAHSFSKITSYEDFRASIPVRTYNTYSHYLQECYSGNHGVILRKAPLYFAMTAGSTGRFKYIPITRALVKENRKSILAFYHLITQLCPETQDTPIQFIVGSAEGGLSPGGIPQGFMSGFNYKNLPSSIRSKFIVPYWVFTIAHAPDRYYAIARYLIDEPHLSAIGAFSPENISNIFRYAISDIDRLINDIRNGTLTLATPIESNTAKFAINAEFANRLANLVAQQAKPVDAIPLLSRALFPCLKYAICWQGGNMGYATLALRNHFPDINILDMPFSASEGIFAIPYKLNEPGGIAAINSHFLEFIPEHQFNSGKLDAIPIWEVEIGQKYYLVITTSGGLYRYCIEDLVIVKDFWGKTPILSFISKSQRQLSLANERLTEQDAVNAVVSAINKMQIDTGQFVLLPTKDFQYALFIENSIENLQDFANEVEYQLCNSSKGYAFEREDRLLKPLRVMQTTSGILDKLSPQACSSTADLPNAQIKPIHLLNDLEIHHKLPVCQEVTAKDQFLE